MIEKDIITYNRRKEERSEMKEGRILIPENLEKLIDLRIPRKQWPLIHHLSKDTAHRPYIHWG